MEFCEVTLTFVFKSTDAIVRCDHSNESSLPVVTHGAIYFSKFHKMKFEKFGRNLLLAKFSSERVESLKRSGDVHFSPWRSLPSCVQINQKSLVVGQV